MDAYDPATVFSSIDAGGRYAFGNQPAIAQWNLARLAEALLPVIDADPDAAIERATAVLHAFFERFSRAFTDGMVAKLGLAQAPPDDGALFHDLLDLLQEHGVDWTSFLRGLSSALRGDPSPARDQFVDRAAFDAWATRWRAELAAQGRDERAAADAMDRVNPVYVPRNAAVEEALTAATGGDLGPFERLLDAVIHPYDERPGLEAYAEPAPAAFTGTYRTFCGT
jgi:uncharacterized protein YdiU (UPF0061 family)